MYQLTYISDGLKVKGYLAFPHGYGFPQGELAESLRRHYGRTDLPVTPIATPLLRDIRDVRAAVSPWPVFLYCRGGIGHVGRVQTHWLERFARHGHLVFAPCYRGSESGEGRDEFGGRDQEDVLAAYRFLESLPFVDARRISVMGFSRGAINAAQAAASPLPIRKLALWSGVSDLARTYEERVDMRRMLKRVIGGSPAKLPEAYRERSPEALVPRIGCPTLVIHGTNDMQVDFEHGRRMYERLLEAGVPADFHRYEGLGHHLPPDVHEAAIARTFDWIRR